MVRRRSSPRWSRRGPEYGSGSEGKGERVMVEFVSANPTGPMHMGNARGGVLGDTLANVLKRDGWDTWKEFYVNDAGNQVHKFAVSIYARLHAADRWGGELPLPGGGLPWGRHPGAGPGLP
ncbi:MAG: arginine--tRNA ligase [Lawsonibacter sp.]